MRVSEAPPAGWYPDPERADRLRWWDGLDWTDTFRVPPTPGELLAAPLTPGAYLPGVALGSTQEIARAAGTIAAGSGGVDRRATDEIIAQVRQAARAEVDRAADVFSQRADAARRQIEPLIGEYTNKFFRWLRIALVIAVVAVVAWVIWQVFVQVSLFDWIGDRIDNLTDDSG